MSMKGSPLKIAVVSQFLGGAERWIREFYNTGSRNNEINIITGFCPDNGMWDDIYKNIIDIKISERRYISVGQFSIKQARLIKDISPDVVLYNNPINYYTGLLYNWSSVVYIYDVETIINDLARKRFFYYLVRKFFLKNAINRACKVIVPSFLTAEKLKFLFPTFPSTKICFIPLGVDTDKFHPRVNGESIRAKLKLNNSPLILYVGRVAENKNIHTTIRAMPKVKDKFPLAKFLIVGSYTGKWTFKTYQHLQGLISSSGLENEVVFVGEVTEDELPHYYAAADILVHMSTWGEGFGFPCVEAGASGKPVVCTEIFKRTGVVTDKTAIIIRDDDIDHLAEVICNLLGDSKLRKRLGGAGRELALKFGWKEINQKVIEVMQEAASFQCRKLTKTT